MGILEEVSRRFRSLMLEKSQDAESVGKSMSNSIPSESCSTQGVSSSSTHKTKTCSSVFEHSWKTTQVQCEFGGRTLKLETGRLAKQADGAVLVTYGDTVVLVTAQASAEPKAGINFLPLTVECQERYYATGRIPGGFLKREGRPSQDATLTARTIDRPIRPLFPEGYYHETQVVAHVLSLDKVNDADIAASVGASAALAISSIPFTTPVASCRVGRVNGEYVLNPSVEQQEKGDMEILVSGTKNAIMMVEGGAKVAPEEDVLRGILLAHEELKKAIALVDQLVALVGKPKKTVTKTSVLETSEVEQAVAWLKPQIEEVLRIQEKQARTDRDASLQKAFIEKFNPVNAEGEQDSSRSKALETLFEDQKYKAMRSMILDQGKRIDGRKVTDVRPISIENGMLPRTHGSSLFTRGETQVLSVVTLGTGDDEQMIDAIRGLYHKKFMLNYNFPPYSVGEVGRLGTPGRREIGHGALAERALWNILSDQEIPYTLRVVCEVLESNGSSSMASVCSGSMALMDAGIKVPGSVAGIAMGLIKENNRVAILSDILGDEDHLGDMDFKVAGTREGVTAIQMDIKIEGVDEAIMRKALSQAREGRMHILDRMDQAIMGPKEQVSDYAPRFMSIQIKPDKIREVIGSGGKVIKDIIARTGCKIDVSDDGLIKVASLESEAAERALQIIRDIVAEPEVGKTYKGVVKSVVDFGAFVEIMPGYEGLLHVSEIAHERVAQVGDHLKEGDEVEVKLLEMDRGKMRLSRRALLERPAGMPPAAADSERPRSPRPPRDRDFREPRDGGGRGRDSGGPRRR